MCFKTKKLELIFSYAGIWNGSFSRTEVDLVENYKYLGYNSELRFHANAVVIVTKVEQCVYFLGNWNSVNVSTKIMTLL